jgi:tRNA A-37 threonylcarbamoyl transferase component Bud32
MNPDSPMAWAAAATAALLSLIFLCFFLLKGRRRALRKGFVIIRPGYRSLLSRLGLTLPDSFLSLSSLTISGHPDRNVSRVTLGAGPKAIAAFLKREHRIPWSVRLRNGLAGFGWVSRSLRECGVLQALQREGIRCPDWIAAGEDGQGRAFLLLRESKGARDLRQVLRLETNPLVRRQLARGLGETLARLHHKGFNHPDLYVNHVLVPGDAGDMVFLDWQRTYKRYQVSWSQRGRDLAALHLTLSGDLVSQRERWFCLRAYLKETAGLMASTGRPFARVRFLGRPECRLLLSSLEREGRRRLRHRHVQEKRRHGLTQARQDWRRLDGEALCVTSFLTRYWPGFDPHTLALERQPAPSRGGLVRRWLPMAGQAPALLSRRTSLSLFSFALTWLRGKRWSSPEQRQSVLLLRLQRHGIPAPRVLAMGQRQKRNGQQDSFLLTVPAAGTLRLDLWLQRQRRLRTEKARQERREILSEVGSLLAQLDQACCYLAAAADPGVLAVRVSCEPPALTLQRIESVLPSRVRNQRRARRDLSRWRRLLAETGCDPLDLLQLDLGYRRQFLGLDRSRVNQKEHIAWQA